MSCILLMDWTAASLTNNKSCFFFFYLSRALGIRIYSKLPTLHNCQSLLCNVIYQNIMLFHVQPQKSPMSFLLQLVVRAPLVLAASSDAIRGSSTNPGRCGVPHHRDTHTCGVEHTRNRTHMQRAAQCAGGCGAPAWVWREPEPSVFITSV